MKKEEPFFYAGVLTVVFAAAVLAGCGSASALFDSIDRLVFPPPLGGTLDDTFGTGGKVTTEIISTYQDRANGVAVQGDGKIVVAGWTGQGAGTADFVVVRYTTTGARDTTFQADGIVTTAVGSGDDIAYAVAIQSDGKIVVAGSSNNGSGDDFAVVRYTAAGVLDATFNGTGKVITPIGSGGDYGLAVAIQSDGKIVVVGSSNNGSNDDFAVVRYLESGVLDTSLGGTGKLTTSIGTGNDSGRAVVIQSDGKIVVAGSSNNGSGDDFAVVRYTGTGALDTTFSADGKATTSILSGDDFGDDVAIQKDGRIVVAGFADKGGPNFDFAVVRYKADGDLDSTFDTDGIVVTPIGPGFDVGYALAIQSDGAILVAGSSFNGTNNDFAAVRYTAAGSLDTDFGTGGSVTTPIGAASDVASAIALQSDGKIVVAGFSNSGSSEDFAVVRYWP